MPIRFTMLADEPPLANKDDPHSQPLHDDLRSVYVKGQKYTLHEGNERLAGFLKQWIDNGIAEIETEHKQLGAKLTAKGKVG